MNYSDTRNDQASKVCIRSILGFIGDDPNREGLRETPDRVLRAWKEMFSGYGRDPAPLFKTFEDGKCDEMVVVRDIDFVSFCEHHMLPFEGSAVVGYLPDGKILGLSKIARVVDLFARRLQVQERLTDQIANCMMRYLNPKGVGVLVTAKHSCMSCRGVKKARASMVTSSLQGLFKDCSKTRSEFLQLAKP